MTPIDVLPDEVLLAVFCFCVAHVRDQEAKGAVEAWQSLVHVCRRWRTLVFGSRRRLNLRLVCTPGTPARECLDVWPPLQLLIHGITLSTSVVVDNIVVALGHSDRVYRIDLMLPDHLQWNKVLATMQVPFPALTDLLLHCKDETGPVIPDTFLGGSAPCLRYLRLERIPFSGIPKLLLSASHLVHLYLHGIPHSGYFSPDAMASCFSVLTSLGTLSPEFLSPRSRPDRDRRPLPMTRSILPNLTSFWFKGISEYLDDLVARFDSPRLFKLCIAFLHQININFDNPHLVQFISRSPVFNEPMEAQVEFDFDAVDIQLISGTPDDYGELYVTISCGQSDQQLSSIAQVCTNCLPPLLTVENLQVFTKDPYSGLDWKDDIEEDQWLEFLRPFAAVKIILSEEFESGIASALQNLVEGRTTEVIPSLKNIFLTRSESSGTFQEAIGQFIAARQLSGHPAPLM